MCGKVTKLVLLLLLLLNVCGCAALLVGAAGSIGTATWLSGKLTQEVNAPFEKTLNAAKSALNSLGLKVEKETVKDDVAQVMSNYSDGRTIWIDIHRISELNSRIEVRVGAVGDKEAARKILSRILRYL